jgi:hypothetical protein
LTINVLRRDPSAKVKAEAIHSLNALRAADDFTVKFPIWIPKMQWSERQQYSFFGVTLKKKLLRHCDKFWRLKRKLQSESGLRMQSRNMKGIRISQAIRRYPISFQIIII